MTWVIVASIGYFLGAVANILDKFLLSSNKISSPAVYAFYVNMLGLGALVMLPFGFYIPSLYQIVISTISGLLFSLGILALYFAIKRSQAGRVIPVIGAVTPIGTYVFSYFLLGEVLSASQTVGTIMLIFGGLLISFDLPLRINKKKFFAGFYQSVLAGLLLALAYAIFKLVYAEQSFLNGFMWTRIGAFCSMGVLFAVPSWRTAILKSFKHLKRRKRENYHTGTLFVSNKLIGGTSSILFNYAIALGSVTLVNSMTSIQYVFVILLAFLASKRYPDIFQENLSWSDWGQRFAAMVFIAVGFVLISHSPEITPLIVP